MKIVKIEVFATPLATAGDGAEVSAIIVRMTAGDGLVGYGEAPSGHAVLSAVAGSLPDQVAAGARVLIGRDAANLNALADILEKVPACGPAARAALDIAAHDLVGKARGVPVHSLLGGALRTRFEVMTDLGEIGMGPVPAQPGAGACMVRLGATTATGDAGRRNLEALLGAAAVTGARIEIDAGEAFESPGQVRRYVEPLMRRAVLAHLSLRQPLHADDLEGHAVLRETLPIHVVVDRPVVSPEAAIQVVRRAAADRIVVALDRLGGLGASRRAGDICESAGIGVSVASPASVGLLETAQCHLAATLRDPYPIAFAAQADAASPVVRGFDVDRGEARLGDRPGLGVQVDERALEPIAGIA